MKIIIFSLLFFVSSCHGHGKDVSICMCKAMKEKTELVIKTGNLFCSYKAAKNRPELYGRFLHQMNDVMGQANCKVRSEDLGINAAENLLKALLDAVPLPIHAMEILCTVESAVSQCVTELVGDTTRDIKNILNLDSLTTSIIKTVPTLLNNVGETLKCALRIDHSRIDALLVSLTDGEKGLLAQILQINCLNILNVHGLLSSLELGKILTPLLASVSGLVSGVLDAVLGILDSLTGVNGLLGSVIGDKGPLSSLIGSKAPLASIIGERGLIGSLTGSNGPLGSILGGLSGSNGLLGGILGGVF